MKCEQEGRWSHYSVSGNRCIKGALVIWRGSWIACWGLSVPIFNCVDGGSCGRPAGVCDRQWWSRSIPGCSCPQIWNPISRIPVGLICKGIICNFNTTQGKLQVFTTFRSQVPKYGFGNPMYHQAHFLSDASESGKEINSSSQALLSIQIQLGSVTAGQQTDSLI